MAWLDWITGKKDARTSLKAGHSDALSSMQLDSTRPMMGGKAAAPEQPAVNVSAQRLEQRRTERNAKRELLFQVVRESMVRIGVLSSAFKFKVLSLDQRGRSFLVMIELSAEFSGEAEKLAEIEALIAHSAKTRYEIVVQAVYWRYFNVSNANAAQVNSPASAPAPLLGAGQAPISRPAPLFPLEGRTPSGTAPTSRPTPLPTPMPAPAMAVAQQPVVAAQPKAAQDELGEDEVAAFRRALAAGAAQGVAATAARPAATPAAKPSPSESVRSKLLLTGYEDTEMADDDPMPALSGTQYGELR